MDTAGKLYFRFPLSGQGMNMITPSGGRTPPDDRCAKKLFLVHRMVHDGMDNRTGSGTEGVACSGLKIKCCQNVGIG